MQGVQLTAPDPSITNALSDLMAAFNQRDIEIERLRSENREWEIELHKARSLAKRKKQECEERIGHLQKTNVENWNGVVSLNCKLTDEKEKHKAKVQKLEAKAREFEAEVQRLAAKTRGLEATVQELEAEVRGLTAKTQGLKATVQDLEARKGSSLSAKSERSDFKKMARIPLKELSVDVLKRLCAIHGLRVSGIKDDFIRRLEDESANYLEYILHEGYTGSELLSMCRERGFNLGSGGDSKTLACRLASEWHA